MLQRFWICVLLVVGLASTASSAVAQAPTPDAPSLLPVFLDCKTRQCDFDYFRQEITYVSYVRNRQDAAVHVLITTQDVGGGGTAFTLDFIGQAQFTEVDATLTYASDQTDTDAQVRAGLARHLEAGLLRYVATTPALQHIDISYSGQQSDTPASTASDGWNLWVFEIGVNGRLESEQRSSERSFRGSIDANRTSKTWKVDLDLDADVEERKFEVNDTTTVTDVQRDSDFETLLVRSIGEHWSIGAFSTVGRSTFDNYDLEANVSPAVEYNVFPYSVSTRRQLLVLYRIGINRFNYREETIFGETTQTLGRQALNVSAEVEQPWGSIRGSIEGSHFLHDFARKRLELFANVGVNLFRGLSLDLFGRYSLIRDQLNLPRGDAPREDILLQRRQLATDYDFSVFVGISYTFGATSNNIVNPRFGD